MKCRAGTQDGLTVEDLGSANGTYVNDKRVQQGFLRPGDELRLDAVRFILVAPGAEIGQSHSSAAPPVSRATRTQQMQMWASILLTLAAVVVIALLVRHAQG